MAKKNTPKKTTNKTGRIVEFTVGEVTRRGHIYHGERNAGIYAERGEVVVHEVNKKDEIVYETNRPKVPVIHIKKKEDVKILSYI